MQIISIHVPEQAQALFLCAVSPVLVDGYPSSQWQPLMRVPAGEDKILGRVEQLMYIGKSILNASLPHSNID